MTRKRITTPLMRGEAVRLDGGPMAGWIVKPGAPVLGPDWYETLLPHLKAQHKPGRYYVTGDPRVAIWKETPR